MLLTANISQAEETIQLDVSVNENKKIVEVEDNIESEFSLFDNFDLDKNDDGKIDEDTLLGKIINRDIVRTDIPSYLLKDELTFRPEKGPVSKLMILIALIKM